MSRHHAAHHRHKRGVAPVELQRHRRQGVHRRPAQLGRAVQRANQRVRDARREVGQIEGVGETIDCLQGESGSDANIIIKLLLLNK